MAPKGEHSKQTTDKIKSNAEEALARLRAGAKKKPKTKREDVNQAAFRVMRESTEDKQ